MAAKGTPSGAPARGGHVAGSQAEKSGDEG